MKKMKRLTFCLALAAVLMAGCNHEPKVFATHTLSGGRCYLQIFDEPFIMDLDTIGTKMTFSVAWPDEGMVSPSALRELQYLYFDDSTSVDVETAVKGWLANPFYEDEGNLQEVESIDEERPHSYYSLEGSCTQDSALAVFTAKTELYSVGAAHGLYTVRYLTVDKETGNVIHLPDLVTDTNLLCEAIAHAIQDLDANKETRECLFDEFKDVDRMPLPSNFVIDSARNNITVLYGLYEITPYCCGIQEITLPIFWLSKHVPLTPYAKRLFGEGCSIE